MIASLPMYWRAENAGAWQAFWRAVQDAAPLALPDLTLPADLPADWSDHWLSPDLALSMTCGLPLRTILRDRVTYVGTLDFDLGSQPGHYHSEIITRPDWSGTVARLAYNAGDSQSGWAAACDSGVTFAEHICTGSHAASLTAVAAGRADMAFIDAVTWRLLQRSDPRAAQVRVAGRTPDRPGLPLITARDRDPAPLARAIDQALAGLAPAARAAIGGPVRLVRLAESDYTDLPLPPWPG